MGEIRPKKCEQGRERRDHLGGAEAEEQGENHPMKLVCKVSACRVSAGVTAAETLQVCIIQKSAAADSDSKVDSDD